MELLTNAMVNADLNISTSQFTKGEFNKFTGNYNDINSSVGTTSNMDHISCWDYWQNWYYPQVIYQSYPVYIKEQALDKGKKAYEIIKILKDKKLIEIRTVGKFIDLMDELIKIL